MSPRAPITGPADYVELGQHRCPQCAGPLARIARRPVDRLLSLFGAKHRYRCRGFLCQWVGNLPVGGAEPDEAPSSPR